MQAYVRLEEEGRADRRTVADALEVVLSTLGPDVILRGYIKLRGLKLPSGKATAVVAIVFYDFGCVVSLPTSDRFRARAESNSRYAEFDISNLDGAEVNPDGSVLLIDGTCLHAVEVLPTLLPHSPSELEWRIVRNAMPFINRHPRCYRSMREGLPKDLQDQIPDVRVLDCSRIRNLRVFKGAARGRRPLLKQIRAYIEDRDPQLAVSDQKIADALVKFGIRVPGRRPRVAKEHTSARAAI